MPLIENVELTRSKINEALDKIAAGEHIHFFFGIQTVVDNNPTDSEDTTSVKGEVGIIGNPEVIASGLAQLARNSDLQHAFMRALIGNESVSIPTHREEIPRGTMH